MEDVNSYIVFSVNDLESVFIPTPISSLLPHYLSDKNCTLKIVPNVEQVHTALDEDVQTLKTLHSNDEVAADDHPIESSSIKCPVCGLVFNDTHQYTKHERIHRNNRVECSKCGEEFTSSKLYKNHLSTHEDEKSYNCVICNAGFNVENNFKVHMALHGSSLACPICELSFQRKASLKSHLAIHQVEEFHTCQECSSEFDNMIDLKKHIKTHTIKMPLQELTCNYCKLKFEDSKKLKEHVACHMKVKKIVLNENKQKKGQVATKRYDHQCNVCDKSFIKFSLLVRHLRIHNGEKPFQCPVCSKGFSQKGTLQIHLLKHTGIKPYCCTLCPAKFYQKCNLKVHVSKTHTASAEGEKSFKCSECDCIFKKLATLNGHMRKIHADYDTINITTVIDQLKNLEKQLDGNIREKETNTKNTPDRDDPGELEKVPEVNNTEENCKVYTLKQKSDGSSKVYVCSFCSKESKKPSDIIRHIRTHTKEKPFECYCGSSFALKCTLRSHMKIHKKKSSNVNSSPEESRVHLRKHDLNSEANSDRKQHVTDSILDKPLKCHMCSVPFTRKINLRRHMKLHSKGKNCENLILTRSSISPDTADKYRKTKALDCDENNRKHPNKSLENHDEGPYKCPYCEQKFKDIISCRQHIDTHKEPGVQENQPEVLNQSQEVNNSMKTPIIKLLENKILTAARKDVTDPNSCDSLTIDNATVLIEESSQIHQQQCIADTATIVAAGTDENVQSILVTYPEIQNDYNNYIISGLKLQDNAIILDTVDEKNEESPIVFNVHTLDFPDAANVLNEDAYESEFLDKSADPVLSVTADNSFIKTTQSTSITLSNIDSNAQNDTGDRYLSNNISLYPQISLDTRKELNTDTTNITGSDGTAYNLRLLDKDDQTVENTLQLLEVPNETDETSGLSMIHCLECKKMFETLNIYLNHPCMQSFFKQKSVESSEISEEVIKKKDENMDMIETKQQETISSIKRNLYCVYCEKDFGSRGIYMRHINVHHKKVNGVHKCKFCEKEFKKLSDLGRHLRTHTGEKPYKCDQCDKKFSLKSTLEGHSRTHNPATAKNFVCEVCNSFFTSKASRKLHMHVHTGSKPHKCNYCEQNFRTTAHRKNHEKKMHLSYKENRKVNQSYAKRVTNILATAVDMAVKEINSSDKEILLEEDTPTFSEIKVQFADPKFATETISIDPTLLQIQGSNILLQEINPDVLSCSENTDGVVTMQMISEDGFKENTFSTNQIENCFTDICQEDVDPNILKEPTQICLKKCSHCSLCFLSDEELFEHEKSHSDVESYSCFLCDTNLVGVKQLANHLKSVHEMEASTQLIL